MDQPLSIKRRQRLSCLLITILTIIVSLSTLTSCSETDTDSSRNDSRTTVTFDSTTKIYKLHDYQTQKNSTSIIHKNRPVKEQTIDWSSSLNSGYSFIKLISSLNRVCYRSESAYQCLKNILVKFMQDTLFSPDSYETNDINYNAPAGEQNLTALQEIVLRRLNDYRVTVNLPYFTERLQETARAGLSWFKPEGKSSFLTGFGLGFLAFGLKKLLLPLFIGAQIVKSVLIAMFLPSILGGLGKLVGKGVTTFASASGSSGPSNNNNVDDFEFKDNMGFDNMDNNAAAESKYSTMFQYPDNMAFQNGLPAGTLPAAALYMPATASGNRFPQQSFASSKVSYASLPTGAQHHYGSYYTRHQQPSKKQDYKVFHNIPSSSLLLTNYDPFYSPLLSRLDSVFKQLGYESESCRERLVCAMYNNPAKFAPYSNLVSAQLSRELNELRKPSTDNPEILRFFRYMKSAKDGQDGQDCMRIYPGCTASSGSNSAHPPMIKTYHDINKLVQARRLGRSMSQHATDGTSHKTET